MGAREKGPKRFRQGAGLVYSCVARYSFVMLSLQKQGAVTLLEKLVSTPKHSAVFLIGYNDEPRGPMAAIMPRWLTVWRCTRGFSRHWFLQKAAAQRKRGEEQK